MNHGRIDVGIGVEVKGAQRLVAWEPGGFDASFGAAAGAVVAFGHQQLGQKAAVAHLLAFGDLGHVLELGADRRQPQHPAGGVDRGVVIRDSSSRSGCQPQQFVITLDRRRACVRWKLSQPPRGQRGHRGEKARAGAAAHQAGPLALAPATSPFCDVVAPAQRAAAFTLRRIDDFRRHTLTQG